MELLPVYPYHQTMQKIYLFFTKIDSKNFNIGPTVKCLTILELAWPGLQDESPPEKVACILRSEIGHTSQGLSDIG